MSDSKQLVDGVVERFASALGALNKHVQGSKAKFGDVVTVTIEVRDSENVRHVVRTLIPQDTLKLFPASMEIFEVSELRIPGRKRS